MKSYIYFLLIFLLPITGFSQPIEQIIWSKVYGGTLSEKANSVIKTLDGGYVMAGSSQSTNGSLSQNFGNSDYWVVKTDMLGNIQWQKVFGGSGIDVATSVAETNDGGFIVAGYTNSTDNNISQFYGGYDFWVVKISSAGALLWQKSYGGTGDDKANEIIQCYDNGYMIVGASSSTDGNITIHRGLIDAWVVKTNNLGAIEWQESLGGTQNDEAKSVIQLADNTFTLACNSASNDINVTMNKGMEDVWISRLSATGTLLSQQSYGGSQIDRISKLIKTKDNNYFAVGSSNSTDGDVTGNHGLFDFWVLKLSPGLTLFWQKSLGGSGNDEAFSVVEAADSSLAITGLTQSVDGDVMFNHGMTDYWTVLLHKTGNLIWQRNSGGTLNEQSQSIVLTNDNNFAIAGNTQSNNGDVLFNNGAEDYWFIKLKCLNAKFNTSNDSVCPGQTVYFTNYSSNANQYIWKVNNVVFDNQFNSEFAFFTPGVYNIKLIASNSLCTDSISKVIKVFAPPIVDIGNDTTICPGISLILNSGYDNTFDINWSTGQTTPTISIDAPGMYWVRVMNLITGCENKDSIIVSLHSPFSVSLGSDQTFCDGGNVLLDPGFYAGASYLWSTNATTQNLTVSTSGTYSVIVTNSFGCKAKDTTVVTVQPKPYVDLGPDKAPCVGSIVVLDAGAFTGASYSWSGGQTSQTISVTASGNYSVTVIGSNSCSDSDTVNVAFKPNPNVNLGSDRSICNGTNTALDAGFLAGAGYLWSTGQTTQTLNVTAANTYSVTVTNSNGCSDRDTIVVTVNPAPIVNLGSDISVCAGSNVTLDAGVGINYSWSTGQTSQTIQATANGNYSVTVTNSFSCTDRDTINVTFNPLPIVNLGSDRTICNGANTALDAGFLAGAGYLWSTGQTTQTLSVTAANTYSVTVTNSNGCTDRDTIVVTVNPAPIVNLGSDISVCAGSNVTLDAGPGTNFSWSTGQTSQTIQATANGNYSVTVTNSFGCTDRDTINVTFNPLPIVNLGSDRFICSGTNTTLDAGFLTGAGYFWSTGQTTQTLSVTAANTYSVTVTNSNGCTDRDTIVVTVNPAPIVNLGSDISVCAGSNVTLDAGPGTNFSWSTGQTSQTIQATANGNYSVTVTNSFGCNDRDTINVTFNPLPIVNLGSDRSICSGTNTVLDAGYITGAGYLWSTGQTTQTLNVSAANTYSVTVTNLFSCTDRDTIVVTVNPAPIVNLGSDISVCAGSNVTLDAGPGTSFSWSTGQTSQTIQATANGNYSVTVTNSFSCTDRDTINVTFNPNPVIITDTIKNVSCNGSADGAIFTSVIGGTGFYTYQWTGSSMTTDDITALSGGSYMLTVVDVLGCLDTTNFMVIEPAALVFDSIQVMNAACSYSNDGTIQVFVSGGSFPYNYSLDNGTNFFSTSVFLNLVPGLYDVLVKDGNNCTATFNGIPVVVLNNLSVDLGSDTIICSGTSITLDAGIPGAAYNWNTLETNQTITTNVGGGYSVTVTSDGCSAADTINVTVNPAIIVSVDSIRNVSCFGAGDGAVFTTFSGGTNPYSLSWSNTTQITEDISNLSGGTYVLTITDFYGCHDSTSALVIEPFELIINHTTQNTSCFGIGDGSILVYPSGGTAPYTYIWSSGVIDPLNLFAGIYSVSVTDSNGCIAVLNDTVFSPEELILNVDVVTDAIVCGSATGAIQTSVQGGTLPYVFEWSGSSSTSGNLSGILPGYYSLTVTDDNGCSATVAANVYETYCQTYVIPGKTVNSICDQSSFYDISPIMIIENADSSSGFISGQNNNTLILNAPTGFEFNPDSGYVYSGGGLNDITFASMAITQGAITITLSTGPDHLKADTLVVYGIEVKALNSPAIVTEYILSDPSSTLLINGTDLSTIYGTIKQSTEMTVSQVLTFQMDSNLVVQGSLANEILGIKISTIGNCGIPLNLEGFELNTGSSDNAPYNIPEAKIFYTGNSPYFAAINVQGTALNPDDDFSVTSATTQPLLEGDNYFWLAYNIQDNANILDYVDAICNKAIIDGNYYYPVFSGPDYRRQISTLTDFVSHGSGDWNSGPTWGGIKALWAPDVDNNVTIINGDTITLTTDASCANLTIIDGLLILGSYQLTVSGNLTGNELDSIRSTSSSSLVINDLGNKDQFPMPKAIKKLKKLTINRTNGILCDHDLDFDDAIPADSVVLVLNNGPLVMSSGKKVFMNDKNIKKEIASSNSSYVDGIISRNIRKNTEFYIFPLGDNGECRQFGVATQNGNNDNISEVQFFWVKPVNYDYVNENFLPGGITDKMYWTHNIITGANTKRRIYYHDSDFPGLNASERIVALCLANNSVATATTEWTKETTPYVVNDDTGNKYVEFSSANASNDEYWTFGSTNIAMPLVEETLPIELYSFNAVLNESVVDIDWVTISEINNDFFTIERAGPDFVFVPLKNIDGYGNSYSTLLYHEVDYYPLEGVSYYRLMQTDYNGDYSYSDLRMVVNNKNLGVLVYPNPVRDELNLQVYIAEEETIYLSLIDDKGSIVYDQEYTLNKGNNQILINVENLRDCPYLLRIDTKNNSMTPVRKMILKM